MNVQQTRQSTLRDFQILQELGKGSFSTVYKAKRIADGQEYALKKVKLGSLKQREKENALNEVRLLYSINDKHIVAYKEAFIDEDSQSLCIVMELLTGGDVYKKIAQSKNVSPFTEQDIWRALIHMTLGLKALHEKKVVHRDLKSANVFLSSDGTFKLGDLNVSKVAKQGLVYTQTGTPYYASPEVWRDEPYDMKSDIWSLGCVVYEMCCLQTPFRAKEMDLLFQKVQKGTYDQIPSHYSRDLSTVISFLLKISPHARPTCDQILQNPIIVKHMNEIEPNVDTKSSKQELLRTIQLPKRFDQLRNQMPKSKYDNDHANKSADRVQDNKSTEKSASPFRSPQQISKTYQDSRITQSQVNNVQQSQELQKNNSQVMQNNHSQISQSRPSAKVEKPIQRMNTYDRAHELKEQKEREIKLQKEKEQLQREKEQMLREKREKDAREAREAKETKERIIMEQKQRELRESRERQQKLQQEKILKDSQLAQNRRVSPISAQGPRDQYQQPQKQKSYSPISRSIEQQQIVNPYNYKQQYGNQLQSRPQISQSINVNVENGGYMRPYSYQNNIQCKQQSTPQSAVVKQQIPYANYQKPITERYQHPQSALPLSQNVREQQRSDRPQVFPSQAKVTKLKGQDINIKKDYNNINQPQRPAGKPSRPLSTNIFAQNDKTNIRNDQHPSYNLITGNYNHYYPIDNYQRHASDQNLIRYQMRQQQERNTQLRGQLNNRQY